ncbi:peptidase M16 [Alteromonas sp. KC3]|uniref:M16 family metallopeptidase n=1 Tax=unclassified Alteromonas TaxID=2614992 RepID=UPI001920414F|nr:MULTISPECIES: pitrilysin family protein [unclassified Alteromonas]BCO19649.1 peptidase M16 [Alteromonas sp. KC3]BCO23614.1 peptidase M16 [Alteromonas sp. KC14]
MKKLSLIAAGVLSVLLSGCGQDTRSQSETSVDQTSKIVEAASNVEMDVGYNVPVEYFTLDNGLKVVLSKDDTAPVVTVAVYYNIGFRNEPKDRTGFAHLFEHMMFQGSENLGKMEFIKLVNDNGGVLNGSTRFDFTNYFEIIPAHKLETFLWAEADRMKGLAITQENLTNQQGVVKNEVKVNVLNRPYGGFPWLDMPQYAFNNWYNAHNFYGDLADLDAANLEDVDAFFNMYYAPNNAVLAVVGDIDVAQAKQLVEKYFAAIPSTELAPQPDLTELRQEKEKVFNKFDKLAPKPAYAFAYKMPPRNTPEYYAMGIIDQILVQGEDSLLYQELVKNQQITGSVNGGINYLLGNMFNYNGPMLWMSSFTHDDTVSRDTITAAIDKVVNKLQETPLSEEEMERAIVKIRSSLFDAVDGFYGFGRADLLASFALFDNAPSKINELEANFKKVTPEIIAKTVKEYLRPTNRTILTVTPGEDPRAKPETTTDAAEQGE